MKVFNQIKSELLVFITILFGVSIVISPSSYYNVAGPILIFLLFCTFTFQSMTEDFDFETMIVSALSYSMIVFIFMSARYTYATEIINSEIVETYFPLSAILGIWFYGTEIKKKIDEQGMI